MDVDAKDKALTGEGGPRKKRARRRVSSFPSTSDEEYEEENIHLKQENKRLKAEIQRLQMELKASQEKAHGHAKNAADYHDAVTKLKNGTDIDGVYMGLADRLDREFRGHILCDEEYRYPQQLVRMSDMILGESIAWGGRTDPKNYTETDCPKEPDKVEYDVHKYMALHTAGRNLAIAAQNLHEEVGRTVDRMTVRHMKAHEMTETLTCPILNDGEPFIDPVLCGSGITFERKALEAWFQTTRDEDGEFAIYRCPSTRLIVNPSDIQPNIIVKQVQEKLRDDFKKGFPTMFKDFFNRDLIKTPRIVLPEGVRVPGDDSESVAKFPPDGHYVQRYRDDGYTRRFSFN